MPLDPQAASVLLARRRAGVRPVEELTVRAARLAARSYVDLQGDPEGITLVDHRFVPGPTADLPVRVYYPELTAVLPALVHFHGGGWVTGNLEIHDGPARMLANRTGCAVVTVNYQKAPEHRFPVPVDDCYAAVRWVADNAAALRIDPARIGVSGDSAGGNLAAAVCLRARASGGPALAYQLLIYPATDHRLDTPSARDNAIGFGLQTESMRWYWNHYLANPADGDHPLASPLRAADLTGLPPALVITAEFDPLRDDGERYARRLARAGVPVRLRRCPGMIHAFLLMAGVLDRTRQFFDEVGAEVRLALNAGPRR